jgi:uridine kinase
MKIMLKRFNDFKKNFMPSDELKWRLILKHGLKEPFLSHQNKLDFYYIGQSIRLNSTYTFIELTSEGTDKISLKTLSELINENKDLSILELKRDIQKMIKKLKKNHKEMDDVVYYQNVLKVMSSKGIEGLKWSESFTQHQHAFVIIHNAWVPYLKLISKIDVLVQSQKEVMIAIDGDAASGKTTLAKKLQEIFHANLFHIDDFFQKPVIVPSDSNSKYGSNIDFRRMIDQIITPIKKKDYIKYQSMNHQTHQLKTPIVIKYKPINIIEGSFSMHPQLINLYDYKIFLGVSRLKQNIRILHRNGFSSWLKFIRRWIPNEKRYFKNLRIEQHADCVLYTNHLKSLD